MASISIQRDLSKDTDIVRISSVVFELPMEAGNYFGPYDITSMFIKNDGRSKVILTAFDTFGIP
jgi:hypothetical protein